MTYTGNTDARRKAAAKYQQERVERLTVRIPKGGRDYYQEAANIAGMSFNAFAVAALDEKIEREGIKPDTIKPDPIRADKE